MRNFWFTILLIWCFVLSNTAAIKGGYSYIGYSLLIATVFGLMSFNIMAKNIYQHIVYHVLFIVSLFYVLTEVAYKFKLMSELLNPIEYDYMYFMGFLYLIISLIITLLCRLIKK